MLNLLFGFFLSWSFATGFRNGHDLKVFPIEGQVTITCAGTQTVTFTCRDRVMEPSPYDFFYGPKLNTVKRYQVDLTAFHQDGSQRVKADKYLPQTGLSNERFNLWISSFFQTPLLEMGRNQIKFEIKDSEGRVEADGSFEVTVRTMPQRQCPRSTYTSPNQSDCSSTYSVCQQYFEQFNFCR